MTSLDISPLAIGIFSIIGGGGIIGILGLLLKLAYNMGVVAKEINDNTEITGKIFVKVTKQDKELDFLKTTKADKKELQELSDKFIKLETEHNICHKKEREVDNETK